MMRELRMLVDVKAHAKVLILGRELGDIAGQLHEYADVIYVTDRCECRMAGEREEIAPTTLESVSRDGRFLFEDNTMDVVFVSHAFTCSPLLLEHSECVTGTILTAFREIARVLCPSGTICMLGSNRYGFERVKEFASFARLRCADMSGAQHVRSAPSFSLSQYKSFLKSTGYNIDCVWGEIVKPDGIKSLYLVDGYRRVSFCKEPRSFKERIKSHSWLIPKFYIIASGSGSEKPAKDGYPLLRIRTEVSDSHTVSLRESREVIVTSKEKMVYRYEAGTSRYMVKIPLSEQSRREERRNSDFLRDHSASSMPRAVIPRYRDRGIVDGCQYYVEEELQGRSLVNLTGSRCRRGWVAEIEPLFTRMSSDPMFMKMEGALYEQQIAGRLECVFNKIGGADVRRMAEKFFRDNFYGSTVGVGLEHGDFSVSNIFVRNSKIIGVIDWGMYHEQGLPMLDAINYLDSINRAYDRHSSLIDSVAGLAFDSWREVAEVDFLNRQFERFRVARENRRAYIYLYWLRHVSVQAAYGRYDNVKDMKKYITDFVQNTLSVS